MPETYREYPVREIAVVTYSKPHAHNGMMRHEAGDIAEVRKPIGGIGLAECKDFLWLSIQGWDTSLLDRLKDPITDKSQADPLYVDESEENEIAYEKARYCIPLENMRIVMPDFSIERATDPNDIYQPFMLIDEGNIVDLATTSLSVEVDPFVWYPRIIKNDALLADTISRLTEDSRLTLPRTMVDPEFAESALDAGTFLFARSPIDPNGLIFDKLTQRYLYG